MLGFSLADMPRAKIRRLKNSDPRIIERYQNHLHDHSVKHKLYTKAGCVLSRATYPLPAKVQDGFAKIDHQRCNGMRMAEKRCRKVHTGKYSWSPEFEYCRKLVSFWSLMIKRQDGELIHARRLTRLLDKLDFTVSSFDHPPDECKQELDKAWLRYTQCKKESFAIRMRYLDELARAIADTDDDDKIAKVLKTLKHREEQRRIAKVIKYTTNRLFNSGTTKVIIVTKNGTREIFDKQELEAVIIAENERKYHRTESYCPLLIGKLRDDIGLCGEGPAVSSILAGTYKCPPGTPIGTVKFLEAMKQPDLTQRVRDIAQFTSIEEFSRSWKKAKEGSSSCGQLHYGHYKAALSHPSLNRLHFTMAQISLESGCYLSKH